MTSISCALHRALLRTYPRGFRERFGDELQRVFEARLAAARARGRVAATWFAAAALADVVMSGMAERRAARLQQSDGRRSSTMSWDALVADVKFAIRTLRRAPVFAGLSILALALGIGANGAIFAAVDNILLRPLPYAHASELVMLWSNNTHEHHDRNPVSPADYLDYRQHSHSFSALEPLMSFLTATTFRDGDALESIQTSTIGTGMFRLLGRDALIGRTFGDADVNPVAVLSYSFWQRRYGGDPSVIGRTVTISDVPGTIVGVMPDDFIFPYRSMLGPTGFVRAQATDVWLPLQFAGGFFVDASGQPARQTRFLGVVGRLKPGVTLDEARADLAPIATDLARSYPISNQGWSTTLVALHEQAIGAVRPMLLMLLAGVGVVWLMACANVANLVLARSVSRQRELAVRSALGASRGRLVQQALVESAVLAAGGAALGGALLYGGIAALVRLAPEDTPRLSEIQANPAVFAYTLAIAVVASLVVGLLPAWATSSGNVQAALKDGSRGATAGPARRRLRAALVVGEIALAVLLTSGAVLLLKSFVSVMSVDPGFRPDRLLTLQINVPARYATASARLAYYDELFERLDQLPGVVSTGGTTRLPLGSTNVSTQVVIEGRDVPAAALPEVEMRRALHSYFDAMGIPILQGRGFTRDDTAGSPLVCVINRASAQRLFNGENPVGRRIRLGPSPNAAWLTIVGVIGDVRHGSLEETPKPELYTNGQQGPPTAPFVVLRTTGDPGAATQSVRAALRALDPATPIFDLRTMTSIRSESVSERRFTLLLVGVFGVLALTLAAVGVYGVMALVVSERTTEVGLRLALGATPSQMLTLILRQAATLGGAGVTAGVAGALLLTPLLASQLYGVTPTDARALALVVVVLSCVALAAAVIPARRAMRVDPIQTLRNS